MCKAHSKVTHIKQKKTFSPLHCVGDTGFIPHVSCNKLTTYQRKCAFFEKSSGLQCG